jgi:hypothetical protein
MKKLLILLLFLPFAAKGQETPPTGADFKSLSTYTFKYYNPLNSKVKSVWMYKGSVLGWTELLGFHRADSLFKAKTDSIILKGYYTNYKALSKKDLNDSTDTDGYTRRDRFLAGLNTKIDTSTRGDPYGVATLNASGKVPSSQISFSGEVVYKGTWNANTDTPTLPAAAALNKGFYYVVIDTGTYMNIYYGISDWIISNGTVWEKVDNSKGGYVPDMYEFEITTDGANTKTIPFTLQEKMAVFFNGSILPATFWTGVSTKIITLNIPVKAKDFVKIYASGSGTAPSGGGSLWTVDIWNNLTPLPTGITDTYWEIDIYGNLTTKVI